MFAAATNAPRLYILVLLSALGGMTMNMFLPSLAHIAEAFEVEYAVASFAISGYLAMTAVLQLIMGPLSDRFGRRPIILTGLVIFTLASLGCALAEDFTTFLTFRLTQSAIASSAVLSLTVVRDIVPKNKAASLIGYVTMATAIGPMTGPALGGMLDQLYGWRATFVFFTAFGGGLAVLCWLRLGETNHDRSETFMKQVRTYPRLLRARRYWGYAICMVFSTGNFFIFITGAPLVANTMFDLAPSKLGFFIGSITAGFMVGTLISGRIASKVGLLTMVMAGRIASIIGLAGGLLLVAADVVNIYTVFGPVIFVGFGNGLTMPSANVGMMSVRPELAGSASGLTGSMVVGGGALLTTFVGLVLTPQNGAYMLLSILLVSSCIGMLAALYVRWVDAQLAAQNA